MAQQEPGADAWKSEFFGKVSVMQPVVAALLRLVVSRYENVPQAIIIYPINIEKCVDSEKLYDVLFSYFGKMNRSDAEMLFAEIQKYLNADKVNQKQEGGVNFTTIKKSEELLWLRLINGIGCEIQ